MTEFLHLFEQYKENVSTRVLAKIGVSIVLYSLLTTALVTIVSGNENGYCYEPRSGANYIMLLVAIAEALVVSLILPCILTVILNLLIVTKLRQRARNAS